MVCLKKIKEENINDNKKEGHNIEEDINKMDKEGKVEDKVIEEKNLMDKPKDGENLNLKEVKSVEKKEQEFKEEPKKEKK